MPHPKGRLQTVKILIGILIVVLLAVIALTKLTEPSPYSTNSTIRLNQELLCPRDQGGGRKASNEEIKRCIKNIGDPYKKVE